VFERESWYLGFLLSINSFAFTYSVTIFLASERLKTEPFLEKKQVDLMLSCDNYPGKKSPILKDDYSCRVWNRIAQGLANNASVFNVELASFIQSAHKKILTKKKRYFIIIYTIYIL
jgi:hypothetical protein